MELKKEIIINHLINAVCEVLGSQLAMLTNGHQYLITLNFWHLKIEVAHSNNCACELLFGKLIEVIRKI